MKTWKKPEVSKTSINMIEECLTAEELSETNGGTPFVQTVDKVVLRT